MGKVKKSQGKKFWSIQRIPQAVFFLNAFLLFISKYSEKIGQYHWVYLGLIAIFLPFIVEIALRGPYNTFKKWTHTLVQGENKTIQNAINDKKFFLLKLFGLFGLIFSLLSLAGIIYFAYIVILFGFVSFQLVKSHNFKNAFIMLGIIISMSYVIFYFIGYFRNFIKFAEHKPDFLLQYYLNSLNKKNKPEDITDISIEILKYLDYSLLDIYANKSDRHITKYAYSFFEHYFKLTFISEELKKEFSIKIIEILKLGKQRELPVLMQEFNEVLNKNYPDKIKSINEHYKTVYNLKEFSVQEFAKNSSSTFLEKLKDYFLNNPNLLGTIIKIAVPIVALLLFILVGPDAFCLDIVKKILNEDMTKIICSK